MGCSGSKSETGSQAAIAEAAVAAQPPMGNKNAKDGAAANGGSAEMDISAAAAEMRAPSGVDNAVTPAAMDKMETKRHVIYNNPEAFSTDEPPAEKVPKDAGVRAVLVQALLEHFLFSALALPQLEDCVDVMQPLVAAPASDIITQGENGETFYVLETGGAVVLVDGTKVAAYGPGSSFGELALMYSCERAATVRAIDECKLWTMDLRTFRKLLATTAASQMVERINFLSRIPLFQSLNNDQLTKLADALEVAEYPDGTYVIREGEQGDRFYVLEAGSIRCTSHKSTTDSTEVPLMTLNAGDYFGEMALLLDEPRNANCIAIGAIKTLSLGRDKFSALLGPIQETLMHNMRLRVLRSVPLLSKLTDQELDAVASALFVESFDDGVYICRQGDEENTSRFYVINEGEVSCTVSEPGGSVKELARLSKGEFFGERALLRKEPRGANVVASGFCDCLVLERDDFIRLLGPLEDILKRTVERRDVSLAGSQHDDAAAAPSAKERGAPPPTLEDLKIIRTLGTGTFGRVKLVQQKESGAVYALKCMMKAQIAQSHQQRNILNEKNILMACDSAFIMDLVTTYNTKDEVMMLTELLLGGELWTYIYDTRNGIPRTRLGGFRNNIAQFYAACVLASLKYLHGKSIAYRDLKPENLVMGSDGYVKMIDFGFAKRIPFKKGSTMQTKSFTLCGTPDYLAPELVLSRGHDKSVDLWAFGCFVYELLTGRTPFASASQSDIFKKIVRSERVLAFAPGFDEEAMDLIKRLLTPAPSFRIGNMNGGVQDILGHQWFKTSSFNWEAFESKKMQAPVMPKIKDPLDASNFERVPENVPVTPYRGPQNVFEEF